MVNLTVTSPSLIVVKNDDPWQTLEELVAEAKKSPGKLTCSNSGYGSTAHFAGELFKISTSTDITHIPMDGTAPALMAVLGGHTSMGLQSLGETRRYIEAGSLRALAVLAKKRLKELPDVPTTAEKGFPEMINGSWQGFSVQSETPRIIIEDRKSFRSLDRDYRKI
jgi:tripartite-type tricarboxylate transporter receptor subunit TctC